MASAVLVAKAVALYTINGSECILSRIEVGCNVCESAMMTSRVSVVLEKLQNRWAVCRRHGFGCSSGYPKWIDTKQREALLYVRFTLAKTNEYALATGLLL